MPSKQCYATFLWQLVLCGARFMSLEAHIVQTHTPGHAHVCEMHKEATRRLDSGKHRRGNGCARH